MTELRSILSPAIHSDERAQEADHPTSPVAKFGVDQPLKLDCGIDLSPFQIAYQTYGELNADRSQRHSDLPRADARSARRQCAPRHRQARLVGNHGRPRPSVRHRQILHHLFERDRRLHGLDRAGFDQSCDRQIMGPGFSGHHHPRHGAGAGDAAGPFRHRDAAVCYRRLDGRHAGAAMDCGLSAARVLGAGGGLQHAPLRAEHRVSRTRPAGRDGRSGLARRTLFRTGHASAPRPRRRADGRAYHLSLRRRAAPQVRAADAGSRSADIFVRRGFPGRELSALPGLVLCRALRRQQLSLSDAGDGLFRYRRRSRRRAGAGVSRHQGAVLRGVVHQRLAVSDLGIAGIGACPERLERASVVRGDRDRSRA